MEVEPVDRWYALTVKPRHEFKVLEGLSQLNGTEGFLPTYPDKRLWSDRVKVLDVPLFTGYVFARFKADKLRMPVLRLGGVKSIVGFGGDPMALADSEIESVRTLVASGFPVRQWPFLPVGQRVRVEHGPLKGAEGLIVAQKDVWLMVVTIELLQRSVAVQLDRSVLKAVRGEA
jgi:transcription antitermination factor NusG